VLADRNIEPFVDPETKSRVEQSLPGGAASPIARRIIERVLEVNRDVFGFRVVGLEDPIRVLGYRGTHADHLREHIDVGPVHPLRKLAFSVLLTDPAQFRGGDLVISGRPFEPARVQGVLTVFPSFIAHRVAPIEEGERQVIVGWVLGPTFV
jgi:PKHD-type hydroxylase